MSRPLERAPLQRRREEFVLAAADHGLDDVGDLEPGPFARHDLAAVAHDRDPIGNLEDFLESVRHVQHGDAALTELSQHGEQPGRLCAAQRRVGLVEDEQAR
jgi:hypothetical protein